MSTSLTNKIDFAVVISAEHANPNGDPLNGNRPRQTYDGFGEISDVCLKRKIRNRLQDMGEQIFVQSDDRRSDDYRSLKERYDATSKPKGKEWNPRVDACATWFDVRAFGQVFAFGGDDAVSVGVRGPVTIQSAYSLDRVTVDSLQITKSVNLETDKKNPDKRGADTMGMKHRIGKGVYVAYGSMSTNLAARTAFSDEDAQKVKLALRSLFENDASSARPEGSMKVVKVVWWQHNLPSGQYLSAKVHQALKDAITADGAIDEQKVIAATPGLKPEFLDQMEGAELAAAIAK